VVRGCVVTVLLMGALASCSSSDDGSRPDQESAAYSHGQQSASMTVERTGRTPSTDKCATAFELLVSKGTEQATDRTNWVAGCIEYKP
jgi:hypothetical protein